MKLFAVATVVVFLSSTSFAQEGKSDQLRPDPEFFQSHECRLIYSGPSRKPETFQIKGDEHQFRGTTIVTLYKSNLTGNILAYVTPQTVGDETFVTLQAFERSALNGNTELANATGKVHSGLLDMAVDFGTHYYPQRKLRIICNPN